MEHEIYLHKNVSRRAVRDFFDTMAEYRIQNPHLVIGEYVHTIQIHQKGECMLRIAPAPYRCTDKREVYSLSKSFTSTAIGLAQDEGILSVEDYIVDIFADKLPEAVPENLKKMKVRHVLSMNTGHDCCVFPKVMNEDDLVKAWLALPIPYEPGTHFAYNTGATLLLGAIIRAKTGLDTLDYLGIKLFPKLGIEGVSWTRVKDGTSESGTGLHIANDDIIKLGHLYLNGGVYNGQRILSEEWVREATKAHSDNSGNGSKDWTSGYGYQFWVNHDDGFRGDGAMGQLCLVLPESQTVVAVQGMIADMQYEMDAVTTLVKHLTDQDDTYVEDLHIPDYVPYSTTETTFNGNGTWYVADPNPMEITRFRLRTVEDKLEFAFSDGKHLHTVLAGNGEWIPCAFFGKGVKPKLHDFIRIEEVERVRGFASYEIKDGKPMLFIRMNNASHHLFYVFDLTEDHAHVKIDTHRDWLLRDSCQRLSGHTYPGGK
ncbi:MAG: serine hydrolase [Clostridia bacterium]|nr:serine hydrolase [Clostridia bacterium]